MTSTIIKHNLTILRSLNLSPLESVCERSETLLLLHLARGNICKFTGDAIVNAANPGCLGGGGVDGVITRAGGQALHDARYALPQVSPGVRCPAGEAKVTIAGNLPCKYVIHTVGPRYPDTLTEINLREGDNLLKSAYQTTLNMAITIGIETIAVPLISAGVYRGGKNLGDLLQLSVQSIIQKMSSLGLGLGLGLDHCGNNSDANHDITSNKFEVFLLAHTDQELDALNKIFDAAVFT